MLSRLREEVARGDGGVLGSHERRFPMMVGHSGVNLELAVQKRFRKPGFHKQFFLAHPFVLADFSNSTSNPVFDGTLKQALAMGLGQSPCLTALTTLGTSSFVTLRSRLQVESRISSLNPLLRQSAP